MTEIPNLHDRFFKDILSRKEEARDFMLHYLPEEVVGLLEADSLELAKDSFVDKALHERFSDLLYRVRLRNGQGAYVYVLFEHKSASEPLIVFHLLRYMVRIWEQWLQQGGVGPLPPDHPPGGARVCVWLGFQRTWTKRPSPESVDKERKNMQETTKEIVQNIGKIFERGLQDEYLSRSIKKIVEHEKGKTSQEIQLLREDLAQFERDYKMSSDEFFDRFEKGELGDKEDYFEWSAIFQIYKRSMERFKILGGIPD